MPSRYATVPVTRHTAKRARLVLSGLHRAARASERLDVTVRSRGPGQASDGRRILVARRRPNSVQQASRTELHRLYRLHAGRQRRRAVRRAILMEHGLHLLDLPHQLRKQNTRAGCFPSTSIYSPFPLLLRACARCARDVHACAPGVHARRACMRGGRACAAGACGTLVRASRWAALQRVCAATQHASQPRARRGATVTRRNVAGDRGASQPRRVRALASYLVQVLLGVREHGVLVGRVQHTR